MGADGMAGPQYLCVWAERYGRPCKPWIEQLRGEDDGHSVVVRSHLLVGGCRQNGAGYDDVAGPVIGERARQRNALPQRSTLPQAREGH